MPIRRPRTLGDTDPRDPKVKIRSHDELTDITESWARQAAKASAYAQTADAALKGGIPTLAAMVKNAPPRAAAKALEVGLPPTPPVREHWAGQRAGISRAHAATPAELEAHKAASEEWRHRALSGVVNVVEGAHADTPGGLWALDQYKKADQAVRESDANPYVAFAIDMAMPITPPIGTIAKGARAAAQSSDAAVAMKAAARQADELEARAAATDLSKVQTKADTRRSNVMAHSQPTEEPLDLQGTQRQIFNPALREMNYEDARAVARSGAHLRRTKDGTYVGGPSHVDSPAALVQMRKTYDRLVDKGLPGFDWYLRTRAGIRRIVGGVAEEQQRVARELAVTSSNTAVGSNAAAVFKARGQAAFGEPIAVKTQQINEKLAREAAGIEPISNAKKTGEFERGIDPTRARGVTGTNDIRQARGFGYTGKDGKPWNQGLTDAQHGFQDGETILAVERANERALGGRTDWTGEEVQAMAWVRQKAEELMAKGYSEEAAMRESIKSFDDFHAKHTFHSPIEATPGEATGHRPDIQQGTRAERDAYGDLVGPGALGRDEHGHDALIKAAGFPFQETGSRGEGIFTGSGGTTEFNRADVVETIVGIQTESKGVSRGLTPHERSALTAVEDFRAVVGGQEASGGHLTMPESSTFRAGDLTGFEFQHGVKLTEDNMRTLAKAMEDAGFGGGTGFLSNTGARTIFQKFGDEAGKITPPTPKEVLEVGKALEEAGIPIESIVRARHDTVYTDFAEMWAAEGPEVTKYLLAEMDANPTVAARIEDPDIMARVLKRYEIDAKAKLEGKQVNDALQNFRQIFGTQGWAGIRQALAEGKLLPAVALPAVMVGVAAAMGDTDAGQGGLAL
jgi:hypothetical protein